MPRNSLLSYWYKLRFLVRELVCIWQVLQIEATNLPLQTICASPSGSAKVYEQPKDFVT